MISILIIICYTIVPLFPAEGHPGAMPAQADTIPAPPDTLPAFPDTIPEEPVTVGEDTIPPVPDPEDQEELRIVPTWPDLKTPRTITAETDSTLRWFMALDWTERLYRKPGVITYRTGRLGHSSGLDIHSYENRHQRLMVNEMPATDPVTGLVNWNRVPIHKIQSIQVDDRSYQHRATVNLREHYVVQPRTYLNFDEGQGNYRNLEFSFTHNFSPETNVELSFWDRRDGDQYPRNDVEGRQIIGKARHNLSETVMLKAGYINNALDKQQPFGYNVANLALYDFNPFNAFATEGLANSNHSTNDMYVQIFQRSSEDDPASRAGGISYQNDSWDLTYSQDTTAYDMRDISAFVWQDLQAGDSTVRARAGVNALRDNSGVSLTHRSFIGWDTSLRGDLPLFSWLQAGLEGTYEGRDDGQMGYDASFNLILRPFRWLELEGFGGLGSSIPDIQSLYWDSNEFQGDPGLQNESAVFGGIAGNVGLGSRLSVGFRADAREVTDGIFFDTAGDFMNIDPYTNLSGSAWLELDSERFEGMLSATGQTFLSASAHPVNQVLDQGGERLWIQGSLHWKNYVFSRAAFVKAGVTGMFSPGNYIPSDYQVPLNRWQHGVGDRFLPDFHRLDVDVSARIRWFMLLIRWENVLDRITQLGYFEADDYPMPQRRLTIGLRVVFTN